MHQLGLTGWTHTGRSACLWLCIIRKPQSAAHSLDPEYVCALQHLGMQSQLQHLESTLQVGLNLRRRHGRDQEGRRRRQVKAHQKERLLECHEQDRHEEAQGGADEVPKATLTRPGQKHPRHLPMKLK